MQRWLLATALILLLAGCGQAQRRPEAPPPLVGGSEQAGLRPVEAQLLGDTFRPGPVVRSGDRRRPVVAITFDDGPDLEYTPRILEILRRYGARATFFFTGHRAQRYPEIVRRAAREGHEVGNHSFDHPVMTDLTQAAADDQLLRTDILLSRLAARRIRTFRPPYGEHSPTLLSVAQRLNYRTVLWDADSQDWMSLDRDAILARILPGVRAGGILLFHSASGGPEERLDGTLAALPTVLETIRARGLWPVTVSVLLDPYADSDTRVAGF